jgi:hypothetical protein
LFLTPNVQVGVIAGTRIEDGGRVLGKIAGVTGGALQGKREGEPAIYSAVMR